MSKQKAYDVQVENVQIWLNKTYGEQFYEAGYTIPQTGETGWDTVNGLIMGLQIELGLTNIAPTFGNDTIDAMNAYGPISQGNNDENNNINKIINGAGWCTGYNPHWPIDSVTGFDDYMTAEIESLESDIGITVTGIVDTKLMKALLSLDAYVIPIGSLGTEKVREYQQWLNGMYKNKEAFYYIPCDGSYGSQTQKGIVFGIQYECDMDDVANGHFGDETKAQLRLKGTVHEGDVDVDKHFVQLFKGAIYCNDVDTSSQFNGIYDSFLTSSVMEFQEFTAIQIDGNGSYETWCELLVSTGDSTRKTLACDCSIEKITSERGALLSQLGYVTVGRYLINVPGGTLDKKLEHYEVTNLLTEGMSWFLIYQRSNNTVDSFSREQGIDDAMDALSVVMDKFNFPSTTIYFPVDFDAYDFEVVSNVVPYFQGIRSVFEDLDYNPKLFKIGVYGARNTCKIVSQDVPEVEKSFVSGMSTAYSGNLGFPLPDNWVYNQISEDASLGIDNDVMRYKVDAASEDSIAILPLEDIKHRWVLTGQQRYAFGSDSHPFLDPSYLGYITPGGAQQIPFSETLTSYSLCSVDFKTIDEEDNVVIEQWYLVDANSSIFFVPEQDIDFEQVDSVILNYTLADIDVEVYGGVGRLNRDTEQPLVNGDSFGTQYGVVSPIDFTDSTLNNQQLTWATNDDLQYLVTPFKTNNYGGFKTYYAMSDERDCIVILPLEL